MGGKERGVLQMINEVCYSRKRSETRNSSRNLFIGLSQKNMRAFRTTFRLCSAMPSSLWFLNLQISNMKDSSHSSGGQAKEG